MGDGVMAGARTRWLRGLLGTVAAALLAVSLGSAAARGDEKGSEDAEPAHGSAEAVTHRADHKPAGAVILGFGYSGTPFAFKRDGEPRGFEVDLARAMAAARGIDLRIRWLSRQDLVPALRAGEVHAINVGALSGAPPADVDVVPYLATGVHAVVRRDNPFAIHAAGDLSGTMVVATMASAGEAFAHEIRARIVESGKAPVEVHTMPMPQYTPVAVLSAHASAYFASTAAVALQAAGPEARVRAVPGVFRATGRLGLGVPVKDAAMKMYLRLALAKVVASGEYHRLLSAYHIPADGSPFR